VRNLADIVGFKAHFGKFLPRNGKASKLTTISPLV